MTQFQQVLTAIKALDGSGTPKSIYEKILELTGKEWGTKTPLASISMYLSTNDNFKKENGIWFLQDTIESDDIRVDSQDGKQNFSNKQNAKNTERGLYFITLSSYIKIPGAGFIFKIGKSDDIKERLKAYSRSLPVDTIQVISHYPIPDPVDLAEAEKEVRGELKGNENLGDGYFEHKITVRPYYSYHQEEWLQTLDLKFSDEEDLHKLAKVIDGIVKSTIETLTPKPDEEAMDD
jgi:hypothetical protein